ncbi:MAG: CDP-diacylglycerol--serine O-phosphatidyltransferase [Verrucomicrobiaceae bacterium]|nr:MAG: CDP-diacylglycerol--serine O-phosphatidyltransferase [Verrucomicrobiaceae bacterium]
MSESNEPKIYLLPNLMTAGNLFCGFAAVLRIIEASLLVAVGQSAGTLYHEAIAFILGACVFDLLDGRLARLGGHESIFGREFDSLADIVSFGVAPALLVYQIVLRDFQKTGWIIAFFFLLCGALRLARFNCMTAAPGEKPDRDFQGFPIPAAAGLIASLTLLMRWLQADDREIGPWKFVLPFLLLFLSFMMFSRVRYPSFKGLNWRTQRSIPAFLFLILLLAITAMNYHWMPAVLFVSFLLYGFVRPFISKAIRREIEEEDPDPQEPSGPA